MILKYFSHLFKRKKEDEKLQLTKKELLSTYPSLYLSDFNYQSKNYPLVFLLDNEKIFAYNLVFSCIEKNKFTIIELIHSIFQIQQTNNFMQAKGKSTNNESIHFSIISEFNAFTIRLLKEIDNLRVEPQSPWISFPEIDPDGLGSLQGVIEFWWYKYWDNYWLNLSKIERSEYYKNNEAPLGWIEYIEFKYE
ncbi:hypothetical protein GCL60_11835 [Silvanigrella paludirubra]|uniref:Uncharacterized protein n=1 Tax=Silvanigrella paludirubra TaxID=2499159 RepID=A0A6N6VS81_9BACT|nr:hypothetical protein [Silvanigrella paludirubra]KAB8037858.1 hypothetical protein GCL60_11835 [Silvanigrella paludirubra]